MTTYPLDLPPADAPDTPVHRTARVLGLHPFVVALGTLGWPVTPRVYHEETSRPGGYTTTWFVGAAAQDDTRSIRAASALTGSLTAPAEKALTVQSPLHPMLAIMAALHSLAALQTWQQRGGPFPAVVHLPAEHGPYCTLSASTTLGTLQPWPHGQEPAIALTDLSVIAAAAAVGIRIQPMLVTSPSGQTGVPASGHSVTFPGLTIHALLAAAAGAPADLPDFPHGEHPFLYALTACRNVQPMLQIQQQRARNPILQRQNPHIPDRRTLVTASLLESSSPEAQILKKAIRKHLEKTIA